VREHRKSNEVAVQDLLDDCTRIAAPAVRTRLVVRLNWPAPLPPTSLQLTGRIGTAALPSALMAIAPSSSHQDFDAKTADIATLTGTGTAVCATFLTSKARTSAVESIWQDASSIAAAIAQAERHIRM